MIDFIETAKLAFKALRANKIRSFLTMLGIVIGVSSVILLLAIGTGLKNYITQQLADLGSDTVFVIPGNMGFGGDGGGGGTPGAGVAVPKFTEQHLLKLSPEARNQAVEEGSFFTTAHVNSSKRVVVLGTDIVEELFEDQDPIGKKITISDQRYTVIGVLEEKGAFAGVSQDNLAYAPWTTVMDQNEMENIQSFWVTSESTETVQQTKDEVEEILLESLDEEDFSTMDTKSLLDTISSILSVMTAALGGIAAISLLVGGIGIMNIMLVSVTERTREIGLRKAIGATPKEILLQFLTEAVVFSVSGGLIGIAIGIAGSLIINQFIQTTVALWSVALSFGVSSAVGIIFGVAPAAKAAKLDPIKALRYE
jgi:putative ABC transport system permease protein